ncbi:MAG: class II aldolase/adducin family protein [Christensenellales bacterium]|jgi:ribulose-5-phosphate 4-epimerase/fuculose-1-phosphate aldolase
MNLQTKFDHAIWVGKALFDRGIVSGSTANMSFLHEDCLFITASGTSFGRLNEDSFAIVQGERVLSPQQPSKELPLHRILYKNCPEATAIIHTHSRYTTYWSCVLQDAPTCKIPSPTPYLTMKIGELGFVPYEHPGSEALFQAFQQRIQPQIRAYLLAKHGAIIADKTMLDAFYCIEELEESSANAWLLRF